MTNAPSTVEENTNAATVFIPRDFVVVNHESSGLTLSIADIVPAGIAYLLQLGYSTSLNQSVAGMAKAAKEEGLDEAAIAAKLKAAMSERSGKILAGDVGTRATGPRIPSAQRLTYTVAEEFAKAKGVKFPTKASDAMSVGGKTYPNSKAFLDAFIAGKSGDSIRAEVAHRIRVAEGIKSDTAPTTEDLGIE